MTAGNRRDGSSRKRKMCANCLSACMSACPCAPPWRPVCLPRSLSACLSLHISLLSTTFLFKYKSTTAFLGQTSRTIFKKKNATPSAHSSKQYPTDNGEPVPRQSTSHVDRVPIQETIRTRNTQKPSSKSSSFNKSLVRVTFTMTACDLKKLGSNYAPLIIQWRWET